MYDTFRKKTERYAPRVRCNVVTKTKQGAGGTFLEKIFFWLQYVKERLGSATFAKVMMI